MNDELMFRIERLKFLNSEELQEYIDNLLNYIPYWRFLKHIPYIHDLYDEFILKISYFYIRIISNKIIQNFETIMINFVTLFLFVICTNKYFDTVIQCMIL
jgi:hypothetical protein